MHWHVNNKNREVKPSKNLQFLKSSQRLYDTQWVSLGNKVVKLDMQNFACRPMGEQNTALG